MKTIHFTKTDFALLLNGLEYAIETMGSEANCMDTPGKPTLEDSLAAVELRRRASRLRALTKMIAGL